MGHLKEPPNKSHQYSCCTRSSSDPPTVDVGFIADCYCCTLDTCKVEVMSSAIPAELLLLFLSCLTPLLFHIANKVAYIRSVDIPYSSKYWQGS